MRRWSTIAVVCALAACSAPTEDQSSPPTGTVSQAITDTDSDGMDDSWETTYFGNLSQTAAGDYDSDGLTNLEEYQNNFNPTVKDALDDADGDRYPNIFEVRRSSNPNDASSLPTANYTVDAAGGGTQTNISAAINAATTTNGAYQIIAIAPGTYTGTLNATNLTIASTKPKLLIIGLQGAAKTIIEGDGVNAGWTINNTLILASVTFRKSLRALYLNASSIDVRLVDVVMRDNGGASATQAAAIHSITGASVNLQLINSTFLNNTGIYWAQHVWLGTGSITMLNTVLWGPSPSGTTNFNYGSGTTVTTNYSEVVAQTLTGTGNLAGTVDPKLETDGHAAWNSPLRAAGGTTKQSRVDMDGEARPSSAPDIGADQFVDTDSDNLPDRWELAQAGDLTTLTSQTQDADSDGLSNETEYLDQTKPTVADTDGDGLSDGDEINTYGTNPLVADTDADGMPDGWEVSHGLSATTANPYDDADGDRYPNIYEYTFSTDPSNASSTPTPTYVVNAAGGGTHTTINAAMTAANAAIGTYKIIGIAAGTYSGPSNVHFLWNGTGKKYLIIGLDGAARTIVDGGGNDWGWDFYDDAIIESLTIKRTFRPIYVNSSSIEVRVNDCIVRDNGGATYSAGVHVDAASKVFIAGSTFQNNVGTTTTREQIWAGAGAMTITNTVVYGTSSNTLLAKGSSATLTTNYSLVKGQTLTGTGNLSGTTDPLLLADLHIPWNSPLRSVGQASGGVRPLLDMDGEARPTTSPDIGADQFLDTDGDGLADRWELSTTGNLTTLTGRTQDADGDGLDNDHEFLAGTSPTTADTDGDGISDGDEVNTYGTNPLSTDTDADGMPDQWEISHGLAAATSNAYDDFDGDRYPNIYEYA